MGQKFGDYSSFSLYVGKTMYKGISLTGQLKYETVGITKGVNLITYNIEDHNTGSKKVLFIQTTTLKLMECKLVILMTN